MNIFKRCIVPAAVLATGLMLGGCVTAPPAYGPPPGYGGGYAPRCQQGCGVVQDVRPIYIDSGNPNGGTLGAVIGAVAGGVLGSTIGKGDGRTAATVVGAVAGGVVGNQIGQNSGGGSNAWRVVVRLDNGQYATVTQRNDPQVRNGDYVQIVNGLVYRM
ncbi:glycine zipper 2TM domain-containing protein [Rhodanobacter sp. DHG33]|uniref:glycine zipper 2TM domain-containing protein n=1 Tax=Rhodanobacter sp. DHG33 TaxID=2775921 RepID=UPI00177C3880|nr:glycine zipper 2TM domain-containing protein [Rhodanobacter sp. DHG33]MBD8899827.1 glycine zipper 2TM domain-containing protein [Rhodanobacter sp. DHG33]